MNIYFAVLLKYAKDIIYGHVCGVKGLQVCEYITLPNLVLLLNYSAKKRNHKNVPKLSYFKVFFIANRCKNWILKLQNFFEETSVKTPFKFEFLRPDTGFPIVFGIR